ncbi:hypothetical protein B0H67DRAFT_497875 [Lasiosphaeris hirsuta]|uniref:MINDY deubiquitinase domain-containing protein n=1 Tax=Lasiosphaeris hirsuta TaxID=260670 RepID=A0AA40DIY2_9PEZI|nr:hypothetical protein B0H67DRAFT_497875 [Lasiosphaeris hirsuta]
MVARKPLPGNATLDPATQARMKNVRQQLAPSPVSDSDSDDIWGDSPPPTQHDGGQQGSGNLAPNDVPPSLRPGSSTNFTDLEDDNVWADVVPETPASENGGVSRIPSVLRPGPGAGPGPGTSPAVSSGSGAASDNGADFGRVPTVLRPGGGRTETNPFKRKAPVGVSRGNSQENITAPTGPPPAPPVPVSSFSQLSVNESSKNPWQPSLEERRGSPAAAPSVPRMPEQDSGNDVWDSAKSLRQATPGPTSNSPALLSLPSDEGSAGWEFEEHQKAPASVPPIPPPGELGLEDSHAWDDLGNLGKGKGPAKAPSVPNTGSAGPSDDWNLIDFEAPPGPPPKQQSAWDKFINAEDAGPDSVSSRPEQQAQDNPPQLPPRRSVEVPPAQPPRPVDKAETYQIKNINWYDVTAAKNPRTSPILVQNANGPCPLVALVNALSLTTPADKSNTALVETLRSREQVSLGLLLDAVFDELMSERRTSSDAPLPDVTELYDFLKGLHTGMNVNPRFIPSPDVVTAFKRTSLTHLHPTERGNLIPGTFERTKEMDLYATFSIPLIHGWLPAKDDDAYDSFSRQAASYEDTQNLLFREEELEDKLSSIHEEGLTEDEQQLYQDILTIKSFLSISATQLTPSGLDVIKRSMMPGSVAILFRNDHFSTLYKHPQTHELLTLVTDAGYAGHAEVVWESLVDVNGEHAEFFSGDFRLVGGASHSYHQRGGSGSHPPVSPGAGAVDGWTPVQQGRGRAQTPTRRQANPDDPPLSPLHEQEDRDLALALQLQEEEDERHRNEQERRRRESMLSEQFIEQQNRSSPATVLTTSSGTTARPGGNTPAANTSSTGNPTRRPPTQQTVRSLIPPRAAPNRGPDDGVDDAPPSYEQAAKATPYVPPAGHPSHPASAPVGDGSASTPAPGSVPILVMPGGPGGQSQGAAGQGPGAGQPSPGAIRQGRFRQGVPIPGGGANGARERDRDCVVM